MEVQILCNNELEKTALTKLNDILHSCGIDTLEYQRRILLKILITQCGGVEEAYKEINKSHSTCRILMDAYNLAKENENNACN